MAAANSTTSGINPFGDSDLARAHSAYAAWRDDRLVRVIDPERRLAASSLRAHADFRAFVLDADFPCVGAKAAINGGGDRFGLYPEMNTPAATAALAHDLWEFARENPSFGTDYATFVAAFAGGGGDSERGWDEALWAQLRGLHELDRRHHEWDPAVSSDPDNQHFSFSFAGQSFFVVGLHPASSRRSRRFARPTLVFNPHAQFGRLRERGIFDRMRQTIRTRDYALQGSLNPNLSDHGERSEARQYSGRAAGPDWKCPFSARAGNTN